MGVSKTDSKKMGAAMWIGIWADNAASDGALLDSRTAHTIMSATQVDGQRTEEEWDALFRAAMEAEVTMKDASDFG